jgi:hypothetical protein
MELISELPQSGFTLYFLGHCDPSLSADERAASRFSREGPCLSLSPLPSCASAYMHHPQACSS